MSRAIIILGSIVAGIVSGFLVWFVYKNLTSKDKKILGWILEVVACGTCMGGVLIICEDVSFTFVGAHAIVLDICRNIDENKERRR